jgi:hypothetical protein
MEEMNQLKMFTIAEANQLLPQLTLSIQNLQKKRNELMSLEVEIDALEIISEVNESGSTKELAAKVEEYTHSVNHFYELIDKIHETGCLLKDVDMGLIDFYSLHKGRVVHLCWKLGEAQVSHWHDVGSGYASREPLDQEAKD